MCASLFTDSSNYYIGIISKLFGDPIRVQGFEGSSENDPGLFKIMLYAYGSTLLKDIGEVVMMLKAEDNIDLKQIVEHLNPRILDPFIITKWEKNLI